METPTEPGSLQKTLWTSLEPFEARWKKGAAALVAIHDTLRRRAARSETQDEFLSLYDWAFELPPQVFTPAWKAPIAFAWVRETYESLGRWLSDEAAGASDEAAGASGEAAGASGEAAGAEAFDRWLDHFKALALGMAAEGDVDLRFRTPYRVELPFSIPGTGRLIDGSGTAQIRGWERGRPIASRGPLSLCKAPTVALDGAHVLLDPYALRGLGLDPEAFRPAVEAGLDYHEEHGPLVLEALRHVQRFAPDVFEQFAAIVRCITLKRFVQDDPTSNVTDSRFPGAFLALRIGNAYDLGETLVHEFHHNRLFVVEEHTPVFEVEEDPELGADRHYSPWRVDPRPLRGLLHAIYVHVPVTRYWIRVLAADDAPPLVLDYARDRIRRASLQLEIACDSMARSGRLTSGGKAILEEIERAVRELDDEIAASGLPLDVASFRCTHAGEVKPDLADDGRPLTVRESVRLHVRRYDSQGEVPATALPR